MGFIIKVVLMMLSVHILVQVACYVTFTQLLNLPIISLPPGAVIVGEQPENYYDQYRQAHLIISFIINVFVLGYFLRKRKKSQET
jgi:hypothetical protein